MPRGSWISPAPHSPHQPDHAQHSQHDKADGDQQHEDHTEPAERSKSPSTHHTRPHHPPTAIPPTAQQAYTHQQDEQGDDAKNGNRSPVNLIHSYSSNSIERAFHTLVNDALADPLLHRVAIHSRHMIPSLDRPFVHRLDTPPFADSCHNQGRRRNPVVRENRNGYIVARLWQGLRWLLGQTRIECQAGDPGGSLSHALTYNRTFFAPF